MVACSAQKGSVDLFDTCAMLRTRTEVQIRPDKQSCEEYFCIQRTYLNIRSKMFSKYVRLD